MTSITLRGDANPTDDIAPYVVKTVREVWTWLPGWAPVVVWFSNPIVLGPAPDVAQAADVETVVSSEYLQLTSISDPDQTSSLIRAVPVTWQVGVRATAPEPGTVHLGLAASGLMVDPGDFTISVQACSARWVSGVCPGSSSTWLPTTDLAVAVAAPTAFGAREVGSMSTSVQRWLLMDVTMTATAPVPGDGASVRLQAWGVGDPLSTGPGRLASTGTDSGAVLVPGLLAFLAIGFGLGVAALARRRGEPDDG
jgi:hypothetical protein